MQSYQAIPVKTHEIFFLHQQAAAVATMLWSQLSLIHPRNKSAFSCQVLTSQRSSYTKEESELLVEARDQRRVIHLPPKIQGKVGGAKFADRKLVIIMQ
ncbi:Uncharacterized protein, chloroplastic [Vitis vinifera]|uniref:Uncharacterized protein, chloroplastic n=1 Tax=Vitis vinifera TaxID=29760 RepID=A0A438JX55_VITVI|nr:Uncharacterized protein, chloroplastic [Vitis vinifera]RVX13550.1 Uncharacterized protein, chloroplastic [Vitis vinifera]